MSAKEKTVCSQKGKNLVPVEGSSNTRLSIWESAKYCLASDLKSIVGSLGLRRGKRSGDDIEMDNGPLSKELGSHK